MKTLNKTLICLLSVFALVGCKDKMIEMNTDPETMLSADLPPQFVGATNNFGYQSRDMLISKYSGVMSLMQYISNYVGSEANPYVNLNSPNSKAPGSWVNQYIQYYDNFSGQRLYNMVKWIDAQPEDTRPKYDDIRAICEILSVYQAWNILSNFGAMVYDDAFQGITDGITEPRYQKIQELWPRLDARLKAAIDVLANPAKPNTVQLGTSDYFNGWTNTIMAGGGSSASAQTAYNVQRSKWLKFGNVFRFEMAWMLAKVEQTNFATVAAEVLAVPNGLMTSIADGTYYNYKNDYDNNPDDVNAISTNYGAGESFVNFLKKYDDPRLPLLARPNGLCPQLSANFKAMQTYFPDKLAAFGSMMDGTNIYIGKNTNPRWLESETATNQDFPTYVTKTFSNLTNPNYPNALTIPFEGSNVEICPAGQQTFNLAVQVVSSSQGRYYVRTGGKGGKNGPDIGDNVNKYRLDGTSDIYNSKWLLRRPIYTYVQQCFLFAVTGTTAGGKTPAQWYAEGVEQAMIELKDDAVRYGVQVAVNPSYPAIPGTRLATIPYTFTPSTEAARIVAALPYTPENAMAQAWIYFYNQPEVAYMWWLRTGLLPVKSHANAPAAAAETVAYLEEPYVSSSEKMAFPRRGCLPDRNTVNTNFLPIKNALQQEPGFRNWDQTYGRIWWDKE